MAMILSSKLETGASSLLQSSVLRPCEPTCSCLAVVPFRGSKSLGVLRNEGHSKFANERSRGFFVSTRATVTTYIDVDSESSSQEDEETSTSELLCCPICFRPLSRVGPTGLTSAAIRSSGFSCKSCRKGFVNEDVYLDLTILEGNKVYDESTTPGAEIFRSPLVSFVYERGWRNSFFWANFPGPDEEFKMAQDYFKPVAGGVLIDVSCGSGLFTRRFAQSGDYESVIASDFSENMLRQTDQFIKQDASLATLNIALVRADVARLPFATGSIDAIHAGAALHCWPSPASAMAEISRVLKPGGVFVGTTFVIPIPVVDFGIRDVRRAIKGVINSSSIHFFEESELEELCGTCGLVEYSRIRRGQFIMISAKRAQNI
ncbi:hypothetical protein M758_6G173400 [Ceratodon purpureus]|nr:hypothetical protein M758_6G173400 [Ceratodon purpureus]